MSLFSSFEWMMASRYIRLKRRDHFISMTVIFSFIGIMLGVCALIIVMSVMNGFQKNLQERILGLNGHVGIYFPSSTSFDDQHIIKRLNKIDSIELITPVVQGYAMASHGKYSQGIVVKGVFLEDFIKRKKLSDSLVQGNKKTLLNQDQILIGHRLAENLRVSVGDSIELLTSQSSHITVFGAFPRIQSFRVGAIFNVGMYEYDSGFIFMPFKAAQSYFGPDHSRSYVEVFGKDMNHLPSLYADIHQSLQGMVYRMVRWEETNKSFFDAIMTERNVMVLILTLIVLVAAFNIITGLIMMVKDKRANIAILRTMGAHQSMIVRIFFLIGLFIGVTGTGAGIFLGTLFCLYIDEIKEFIQMFSQYDLFNAEIYYLSKIPVDMRWADIGKISLFSLILCFLASLYPSWRASRVDPVEALRYE